MGLEKPIIGWKAIWNCEIFEGVMAPSTVKKHETDIKRAGIIFGPHKMRGKRQIFTYPTYLQKWLEMYTSRRRRDWRHWGEQIQSGKSPEEAESRMKRTYKYEETSGRETDKGTREKYA